MKIINGDIVNIYKTYQIVQKKMIAETYYLYRTMLYALHKDDEDWSVYKDPALRCADSGEVIEIEEIKKPFKLSTDETGAIIISE